MQSRFDLATVQLLPGSQPFALSLGLMACLTSAPGTGPAQCRLRHTHSRRGDVAFQEVSCKTTLRPARPHSLPTSSSATALLCILLFLPFFFSSPFCLAFLIPGDPQVVRYRCLGRFPTRTCLFWPTWIASRWPWYRGGACSKFGVLGRAPTCCCRSVAGLAVSWLFGGGFGGRAAAI